MEIFFLQQSSIIGWLQSNIFSTIPESWIVFSSRYIPWIIIALVVIGFSWNGVIAVYRHRLRAFDIFFWSVIIAVGIAGITSEILKTIIAEPRPFLTGVRSLYVHGGYDGFPSGHTLLFTTLAVAIMQRYRIVGWVLLFFAVIIGCSRVIAGIHWPLDIVAGFVIGIGIGKIGIIIAKKIFHRK